MGAEHIKSWMWKPGQSGNPAGKLKKPRRSFDAVRRLEELQVDPLAEVVALAQDPTLPKTTRLKAWMALLEYSYPKVAPVMPSENVSATLVELQRAWDTATLDEFKQAFSKEFSTLPDEATAGISKLEAMGKIGPIMMQALIKFVEMRHEQAKAQGPEEGGLKVVKLGKRLPPQVSLRVIPPVDVLSLQVSSQSRGISWQQRMHTGKPRFGAAGVRQE